MSATGAGSLRSPAEGFDNAAEKIRRVAIGSDHGGFEAKELLKSFLAGRGYGVTDVGTNGKESVDYPDFAVKVAREVSSGRCERGIMVDGAGIGSCMVCNKVHGIRAALCYDRKTAANSREHNDANVLTLGDRCTHRPTCARSSRYGSRRASPAAGTGPGSTR